MIKQIQAMIWKEWNEILFQRERSRTDAMARTVLAVMVFGILVWRVGLAFVDRPSLLLMPAFILVFCIVAIVADSFAGERERHTLETLLASPLADDAILFGKIVSAVLLVWGLMFLMLLLGITEVNLVRSAKGSLILPLHRIVSVLGFAFLLCVFVSCIGVFVSMRVSTVRQATQILNVGFMVLGFASLYASISVPQEWHRRIAEALSDDNLARTELIAGVVLAFLDVALLAGARFSFRRQHLSLD